jgi:hypothetical protein
MFVLAQGAQLTETNAMGTRGRWGRVSLALDPLVVTKHQPQTVYASRRCPSGGQVGRISEWPRPSHPPVFGEGLGGWKTGSSRVREASCVRQMHKYLTGIPGQL